MDINVRYSGRDYGTNGCSAESYIIELSQHETSERPKDATFPHKSDKVRLEYKCSPGIISSDRIDAAGVVTGATLSMSVEEAEELGRLLLDSIQQAKGSKAPVVRTVDRTKEIRCPIPGIANIPGIIYGERH